jgi:RNA-directed DNA polymerase
VEPYIHIKGNLYVVLTPLKAGANKSIIEDCFGDDISNLSLGGKTLNPDNKADSSLYFSKQVLSQYVREHAAKIDFTGFSGLLDRITAAIEAHQNKQVAVASQDGNAVSLP